LELKAEAEAYKQSEEGQAAKAAKRGRKKAFKGWSAEQKQEYTQDRLDAIDRGSVVSSHFNESSTVASSPDVAVLSDLSGFQIEEQTIPEEEPVWSTGQPSTGWSASGWSASGWSTSSWNSGDKDKWHGGWRKYRHVQNGAARATVLLVAATLLRPSEAVSTVAILAPSSGALLLLAKLYVFSTTMKVVNKVSEEAHFLVDNATDATEQAIAWTFWLYKCVGFLVSLLLLWGSYKWAKRMGLTRYTEAGDPSGFAPEPTSLFAQYGDWLTESKIRSVTRNSKGALSIAENSSNIRPMPYGEGLNESARVQWGDVSEFQVLGQSKNSSYCVLLSSDPKDWMIAKDAENIARLVKSCNCSDAVIRGPICKHAAACLIAERRRASSMVAEKIETKVVPTNSFTASIWMIDRFRRLTAMGRSRPKQTPASGAKKELLALQANPLKLEVTTKAKLPSVRAIAALKDQPKVQQLVLDVEPQRALTWKAEDAAGSCRIFILNGAEAQDAVLLTIQESSTDADIRLMAYTFDYPPLVAALCTAKTSAPERRIEVVLDRGQTFSGPTKNQNAMARQLIEAGVQVRCSRGKRLSPVYEKAGRATQMGSLMGALHAKAVLIGRHAFIGSTNWTVWNAAKQVDTKELIDQMNDRIRVKAAKDSAKG
jgi:hypothetical protein